MKKVVKLIVKFFDLMSSIYPLMMMDDWDPPNEKPIAYGMSVMAGILTSAVFVVCTLVLIAFMIGIIASYPISSISIIGFFGFFVALGFSRRKIEEKLK